MLVQLLWPSWIFLLVSENEGCFLMCWACCLMVSTVGWGWGVECTILPFPRGLESHQQIERKFSFFPFFWPKENEVNPTEKTIVFLQTIFIFKMNRFGMMLKIKKKNWVYYTCFAFSSRYPRQTLFPFVTWRKTIAMKRTTT